MEWIDVNTTWREFSNTEACRPGVLVDVLVDGEHMECLIGDINRAGGVCDDCMKFDYSDIVVRYKICLEQ